MAYGERERLGVFEQCQETRRKYARFIEHRILPVENSSNFRAKVKRLTDEALNAKVARIVAARIERDMPAEPLPVGPAVKDILATVPAVTGYTSDQLCGPWRNQPLAKARFLENQRAT